MDETYIKVRKKRCYQYRVIDSAGNIGDFILSKKRNKKFTKKFLKKLIKSSGSLYKINFGKNLANNSALETVNQSLNFKQRRKIQRIQYLNNLIEQDHHLIKKIIRPTKRI